MKLLIRFLSYFGRISLKRKSILPQINCKYVGENSYCAKAPFIVTMDTCIGKFCSLGENVRLGHGEHPLNFLSTSPYFYLSILGWKLPLVKAQDDYLKYKPINIGNDVWIGDNVCIKNGITIGDGAIIGMGAVVTKDVPPYAIVAGSPGKIIKYRFKKEIIEELLRLKWWDLDEDIIKHIPYDDINEAIKYIKHVREEL